MDTLTSDYQVTDTAMSLRQRIRKARAKFAAMAGTYFIGVFNDNFFKQAALLMAVASGQLWVQGWATVVFTLPFILFAAYAGWCADRFAKRSVVIAAKSLELIAMLFGAVGIIQGNWTLILVMLGIEGTQAAIFSPSLNGSIPELYPPQYVITANAIIRMVSTAAILIGIALAGFVLDIKGHFMNTPLNLVVVAALIIGVSACGVLISLGVAKFPAANPAARFPRLGPIQTLIFLYKTLSNLPLAGAITANAFFWFIGSLNILVLNQMGLSQFNFTNSITSTLAVAELVGIAIGGLLSVYFTKRIKWHRLLVPAVFIMAICMLAVAAVPYLHGRALLFCLYAILALLGMAGGIYMIPLEAFIQVRPDASCRGAAIAAANFAAFSGILLSGPTLNLLNYMAVTPCNDFAIMGVLALAVTFSLIFFNRKVKWDD